MTERNRTLFQDGPIKPHRSPRSFFRTASDGLLKTLATDGQNSSDQSRNQPVSFSSPPVLKGLSTSACNGTHPSANGTHPSVNGTNGVHTGGCDQNGSKKTPLLPPGHCRLRKCDSSDSSGSNSSSGSVFRPADSAAQFKQDGQLSDRSCGSAEPKRPLMPPTKKPSPRAMVTAAVATSQAATEDNEERGKTKPLPLPRGGSRSPGNTSENAIMEVEREGDVLEDGSNSGHPLSNQDDQQPDVHHLQSENEALKLQIFRLQQQLLQQSATGTGSDRSETGTPVSRCSSRNAESPTGSSNSEMGHRSPSVREACGVQSPVGDVKSAARIQLSRVIERAKANSQDVAVDSKKSSQLKSTSAMQPVASCDVCKSPNPSITSPLSPLSPSTSTPSPTTLVTFGLSSQAKRKREKKSNNGRVEVGDCVPNEKSGDSGKKEASHNHPQLLTQPRSTADESADVCESREVHQPKLGRFAGKSNKSIVSTAAKLFQTPSTDSDVGGKTATDYGDNERVQGANVTLQASVERGKESVSSENDEVFSATIRNLTQPPPQPARPQRTSPRTVKSKLPAVTVEADSAQSQKSGVVSKRVPIKSDISWIKPRRASKEDEDKTSVPSQRSHSPSLPPTCSTPPLRPFRSHQMLNTVSPPPPLGQTAPPPRTFNASSQLVVPGAASLKPTATHHRSQGLINAHPAPEGDGKVGRQLSISKKKGSKSKRGKDGEGGMARSVSDESLHGSLTRGTAAYSSHRGEVTAKTQRLTRPPPVTRNISVDRVTGRPVSVVTPPRAWEDGQGDLTVSCTVPSTTPPSAAGSQKSPKRSRFKKPSDPSPLAKKGSIFGRLKGKTRDKEQPRIPEPALEEEEYCGSDSSSEDEKGATIKYKPKLRPVSVRRPSQVEDDFDLSYPQLFERVFVVGLKQDETSNKLVTEVTYTFPPRAPSDTVRDETMEAIPQFCFPDIERLKPTTKFKSETFSFVLTNIEGSRRFGYCRRLLPTGRSARLPEVTCIVSPLGCFSLYEKILDHIEDRRRVSTTAVFTFLKAIVANPFPKPGRSVEVRAISPKGGEMETVTLTRPLDSRLEHVDFSLLFATLSPRKIIQLFSSMLMERRIILCSSNLSLMTGCAHALLALLYPFEWQHVFIPILPGALIDFCCSPLPYMMGLSPSLIPVLDQMETMEEALVVDLDKKKFALKIGDETSILPSKLFQYLENMLSVQTIASEYQKPVGKRSSPCRADEIVINTFNVFFVYLFGDYKKYMKKSSDGGMEFQRKEYPQKFSSKSIRRFLEAFYMTQMFENFVEQRENPLKSATTAQSTFERHSIPDMKDRCLEIEIFSSKSKVSRWRLRKRN